MLDKLATFVIASFTLLFFLLYGGLGYIGYWCTVPKITRKTNQTNPSWQSNEASKLSSTVGLKVRVSYPWPNLQTSCIFPDLRTNMPRAMTMAMAIVTILHKFSVSLEMIPIRYRIWHCALQPRRKQSWMERWLLIVKLVQTPASTRPE